MSTPSTVYLVRHAKAGERRIWNGDDTARPLSKTGWKQAVAIAERLRAKDTTRLVASPFTRCVQTLEPLGSLTTTDVEVDDRLAEGGDFEPVLELVGSTPAGTVLCSHGDIIPAVIHALHRRGMELQTPPDWRKGTIWVLKRKKGHVTSGKVWRPSHE